LIEGPVLSPEPCGRVEGLLLCTCAEPCPDDRSGSIQYQDKEVRKESMINEENTFKDLVPEMSGLYIHDFN
jgi:hypothetical protein